MWQTISTNYIKLVLLFGSLYVLADMLFQYEQKGNYVREAWIYVYHVSQSITITTSNNNKFNNDDKTCSKGLYTCLITSTDQRSLPESKNGVYVGLQYSSTVHDWDLMKQNADSFCHLFCDRICYLTLISRSGVARIWCVGHVHETKRKFKDDTKIAWNTCKKW